LSDINDKDYYLEQLEHQVSFLVDSSNAYDHGKFAHSKLLSNIIRTIVKDVDNPTPKTRTKSLLFHLDRKQSMKFNNTGFEAIDPIININLVGIVNIPNKLPTSKRQSDNIYLPLLNQSVQIDVKWLPFEDWWNSKIIVYKSDKMNVSFTRKTIVMTMAEQDGGTHVDTKENVEIDYLELATATKNLFINVDKNGKESPIINLHYALVRQIAHELIISLIKEFKFNILYNPTNKHNLRGVPESEIKQFGVFAEENLDQSVRTKTPNKQMPSASFKTPDNAAFVRFFF
jgi:hypothetical protein